MTGVPTRTRVPGGGFCSTTMARLVSAGAPPLTSSLSRALVTSGWATDSDRFSSSGTTVSLSGTMISGDGPVCREAGTRTTTVTVVPAGTIVFGSGFCSTTMTLFGSTGASPLTCSRRRASVAAF
jgi:hypothetical protein